ncbi:MAG: hypothetical protein ACM3N6_05460, partial [Betaproteobacteria bacterium]
MRARAGGVLAVVLAVMAAGARAVEGVDLTADEPRAFGHSVGDVVTRHAEVVVPKGLRLDEDSLPQTRRGGALELREVHWQRHAGWDADRYELRLTYQVFRAPREVRVLEMPPVKLRFLGTPREQEALIEAWPVAVAPLGPLDASPRTGLGELRPDIAPPPIDTAPERSRLLAEALVTLVLLVYLGWVYFGTRWWRGRHRPFALAWHELRALPADASVEQLRPALRRLHEALNRTAGQVVFEDDLDRFLAATPRYAPLRADFAEFFRRSREAFFAPEAVAGDA